MKIKINEHFSLEYTGEFKFGELDKEMSKIEAISKMIEIVSENDGDVVGFDVEIENCELEDVVFDPKEDTSDLYKFDTIMQIQTFIFKCFVNN